MNKVLIVLLVLLMNACTPYRALMSVDEVYSRASDEVNLDVMEQDPIKVAASIERIRNNLLKWGELLKRSSEKIAWVKRYSLKDRAKRGEYRDKINGMCEEAEIVFDKFIVELAQLSLVIPHIERLVDTGNKCGDPMAIMVINTHKMVTATTLYMVEVFKSYRIINGYRQLEKDIPATVSVVRRMNSDLGKGEILVEIIRSLNEESDKLLHKLPMIRYHRERNCGDKKKEIRL